MHVLLSVRFTPIFDGSKVAAVYGDNETGS